MNATTLIADAIPVCSLDALLPGMGVAALIKGEQIAIFKLRNGEVHAVGNYDPFSEAYVISRGLTGDLKGRKVVASPIYKHHFDLHTGECLEDSSVQLPVYSVKIENNQVYVLV